MNTLVGPGLAGALVGFLGAATTIAAGAVAAGQVLFADGGLGAPGIAFASHPDAGIYYAPGNGVGITQNGGIICVFFDSGGAPHFSNDLVLAAAARIHNSSGSVFFLDGSANTLPGGFNHRVLPETAAYTIQSLDSGVTFTNTGAVGSVTYTLPTPAFLGFHIRFVPTVSQAMVLQAPAGMTMRVDETHVSSSGGTLTYAIGSIGRSFTLEYVATNTWQVIALVGTAPTVA